jgi:cytoplasmic iron level regulating protein YaaA (DUF328/UPF0246 family)
MKLILISCSGKKAPGGGPLHPPSRLKTSLSPAAYRQLLGARQELKAILQETPGHALGIDKAGENKYQPAYQRYQGFMYLFSDFYHLFPQFEGRVLIVSGMYGLLDAGDYLRNYNLRFMDSLPTGQRVDAFWKQHGLKDMLVECISRVGADEVHDLLPEMHRKMLAPWPDPVIVHYQSYTFPAPGQGTGYERATALKSLLTG